MNSSPIEPPVAVCNHRFREVISRDITVPRDYRHTGRISLFLERHHLSDGFYRAEVDFSDRSFNQVTEELIPSQRYRMRILQVVIPLTLEEALRFLRRGHSAIVSAQGLTVLWEAAKNELPTVRRILSLDDRNNLPLIEGRHMMPYLFRNSNGSSSFHLDPSHLLIDEKYCLVTFEGLI